MGRIGETAVILRVELPLALEALRLRSASCGSEGLPAHVTLLYPFVALESLDPLVRVRLAQIAASHPRFAYRLGGPNRWPEVLYAAVEPQTAVTALQADLARSFPEYPLYEGKYDFTPHVTIATGAVAESAVTVELPAWGGLSGAEPAWAKAIEVIFRTTGNWSTMWRIPLAE